MTTLVDEASRFILRGFGMSDPAISAALGACTANLLEPIPA